MESYTTFGYVQTCVRLNFFWIRIKLEILKVESNQLTTQQFFSEV